MFFTFMLERSAAQPVAAQVLYAGGEREGGGVDGGRGGVPQAQTPKGLLSGVRPPGCRVTHIYNSALSISICTKPVSHHQKTTSTIDLFLIGGEIFPIIISISILSALILTVCRPVSVPSIY